MSNIYIESLPAEIARLYRMHHSRAAEITALLKKAAKSAAK